MSETTNVLSPDEELALRVGTEISSNTKPFYPNIPENLFAPEEKRLELEIGGHQDVIDFLRQDKDLEEGEEGVCLVILGGGQAGDISASVMLGMDDRNIFRRISALVGQSAGAANSIYYASGNGEVGETIYREENIEPGRFILLPDNKAKQAVKLSKVLVTPGPDQPLIDPFASVGKAMREGNKKINIENVKNYPHPVFVQVMNAESGEIEDVDIRHTQDPILYVEASFCVPGVTPRPWIQLPNGKRYVDPAFGNPIPLETAKNYKKVLILSNVSPYQESGPLEAIESMLKVRIAQGLKWGYGQKVIDGIKNYPKLYRQGWKNVFAAVQANDPNFRIAYIAPIAGLIGPLEKSTDRLSDTYMTGRSKARAAFKPLK